MSTLESCPLCHRTKGLNRKQLLYGRVVCKKCRNGFANRRQMAFVVDLFLIRILDTVALAAMFGMLVSITGGSDDSFALLALLLSYAVFIVIFLAKDAFQGLSPGKALFGVQAVNRDTLRPIGFTGSAMRNANLIIPLMPLVVAVQLLKGYRLGDGWAHTKVIWRRYADHPVFTGGELPQEDGFGPAHVELPPVDVSSNPFQSPRN